MGGRDQSQMKNKSLKSSKKLSPFRKTYLKSHNDDSIKRLVDQLCLIINTEKEKIDKKWIRALIDTTASDEAVDNLSAMIQHFHGGFFARHKQRKRPKPSKQQKISNSTPRRCPPSPTMSTPSQDSCPDSNYSPPQPSVNSLQCKRKRERLQAVAQVSASSPWLLVWMLTVVLKQTPQQSDRLPSSQPPSQQVWTRMLPEPQLISRLPTSPLPLAHNVAHLSSHDPMLGMYPHQQPTRTSPAIFGSPRPTPNTIYITHPTVQPMFIPPPSPQPSSVGTSPPFSSHLYPHYRSQPLPFPTPAAFQQTQIFASPSESISQPLAYPHNSHIPPGSRN